METNDIICVNCPEEYGILISDGKCFNCEENDYNCQLCEYANENTKELICTLCKPGFYLNSEQNVLVI